MKQALVISKQDLHSCLTLPFEAVGEFTGKVGEAFYSLETLLASRHTCEKNPNYLQIIPYITLMNSETHEVFVYTRGDAGDEGRLHGKCSIGVGGHIDIIPNSTVSFKEVLILEALREIEEEVGIKYSEMEPAAYADMKQQLLDLAANYKFIFNNTDDVGKVHLGVSIVLTASAAQITALEEGHITSGTWKTINDLLSMHATGEIELEAWSKIAAMNIQSVFSNTTL